MKRCMTSKSFNRFLEDSLDQAPLQGFKPIAGSAEHAPGSWNHGEN